MKFQRTTICLFAVFAALFCSQAIFAQTFVKPNLQVKPNEQMFDVPAFSGTKAKTISTNLVTAKPAVKPTTSSVVEQLIFTGSGFESKSLWGEALTHYEKAVKQFPENTKIKSRLENAKVHYDLKRRYLDPSYVKSTKTTSEQVSLEILSEILMKIQNYYVDNPDWKGLCNKGIVNLDAALFDEHFQKNQLASVDYNRLHQAQTRMHQVLDQRVVQNRQDTYQFVRSTAHILNTEVGVSRVVVIYEFISAAINSLDPYSSFLTRDQFKEVMSHIEGNFVGLGVEIRPTEKTLDVVDVIRGGSASNAGIKSGDRILAVDGALVEKVGGDVAADMLRGVEGSVVQIDLLSNEKTYRLQLKRTRVDIPSIEKAEIVDPSTGVAYIKLSNFQKTTQRDFDSALWNLHRSGMRSLIVDVRGNPGGLLNASVDIADRFVSSGIIVSTRGRNPREDFVHRARTEGTWRVPLTVLIDENSASASEIFAGAIRDHKRGTIVGERSYGKGSVQGIFPLSLARGGLRLTTAKFYSPLGHAISNRGVYPDVTIEDEEDVQKKDDDKALVAAVEIARNKVVRSN